jgi:catechol 2,3-dioxygenase-like lactoylglutathione lyase family enzyme
MKIHHSAICTRDLEGSLRFWRDGLGFVEQMDQTFAGDWPALFEAREPELRSVFLGDPADTTGGLVELVEFTGGVDDGVAGEGPPTLGFFLVSVYLEIEPVLERLTKLGFDEKVRRITVPPGVHMAVVHDPNGVRVELIDLGSAPDPLLAE